MTATVTLPLDGLCLYFWPVTCRDCVHFGCTAPRAEVRLFLGICTQLKYEVPEMVHVPAIGREIFLPENEDLMTEFVSA